MTKTEQAAKAFFTKLTGGRVAWDYTDHKAKPLVLAAFDLYARDWSGGGPRWDIRQWEWPAATLDRGEAFAGDQTWAVLLRRAVEIARAPVES